MSEPIHVNIDLPTEVSIEEISWEWSAAASPIRPTQSRKVTSMNRDKTYRWILTRAPRIRISSAEGSPSPIHGHNIEEDRRRGAEAITLARKLHAATNQPSPEDGGWQPIETAPKDGTWILIWGEQWSGAPIPDVGHWDDDDWRDDEHTVLAFATHWQPLPAPPTTEDGGEGK